LNKFAINSFRVEVIAVAADIAIDEMPCGLIETAVGPRSTSEEEIGEAYHIVS